MHTYVLHRVPRLIQKSRLTLLTIEIVSRRCRQGDTHDAIFIESVI